MPDIYMEIKAHPFNTLGDYIYADIISFHKGQWIFSKHKNRITWETQGGHIEEGETPLEAAKRELYEEAGAVDYDIEPLCDYWVYVELEGKVLTGNGQVYFANVHTLTDIPCGSEMEKICLFDSPPDELTYPAYYTEVFPLALEKMKKLKIGVQT
jgi:8-oxo-dGTP diphosphatase